MPLVVDLLVLALVVVLLLRVRHLEAGVEDARRTSPVEDPREGAPWTDLQARVEEVASKLPADPGPLLHEALSGLREEVASLREDVSALRAAAAAGETRHAALAASVERLEKGLEAVAPDATIQLRSRIVAALLERGCHSPRLLAEPPVAADGVLRLPVAAVHNGARVRGTVTVEDGAVTAVELEHGYEAFP